MSKIPLFKRPLTHDWTLWMGLAFGLYAGVTTVWGYPGDQGGEAPEQPPAPVEFLLVLGLVGLLFAFLLAEFRRLTRFLIRHLTRRRST